MEESFTAFLTKPVKRAALEGVLVEALSEGADATRPTLHEPALTLGQPAIRPLRMLLAEDNSVNQRVASAMLAKLGQSVDVAADGEAAVKAVSTTAYDIVLMDVQMPTCDGLEATRRIRANASGPQPYIVAMTAGALQTDRDECAAAGMDAYLAKPVRAKQLQDLLVEFAAAPTSAVPPNEARISTPANTSSR